MILCQLEVQASVPDPLLVQTTEKPAVSWVAAAPASTTIPAIPAPAAVEAALPETLTKLSTAMAAPHQKTRVTDSDARDRTAEPLVWSASGLTTQPPLVAIAAPAKATAAKSPLEAVMPQLYPFVEPAAPTPIDMALGWPWRGRSESSETGHAAPQALADPELGILRIREASQEVNLSSLEGAAALQDPELGNLRVRPLPPPPTPQPSVFFNTYVTVSSSDNVFLVDYPTRGRLGDTLLRPGVALIAYPALGPRTRLLAGVETNFFRYQDFTEANYNELRGRLGVRHQFSDRVYGQLGWTGQLLYEPGFTHRFFTNHSAEWILGRRDALTPNLTLETYYQGQWFLSDPSQFSTLAQSVGAALTYRFQPQWQTRLNYRLTISDFTQTSRHETYQRITGQLRYSLSPSVNVNLFGGLSLGRSSQPEISFDDTFFGISLDAIVPLF